MLTLSSPSSGPASDRGRPLLAVSSYAVFVLDVFKDLVFLAFSLLSGAVTLQELVNKAMTKVSPPVEVKEELNLRSDPAEKFVPNPTTETGGEWISAIRGFCRAIVRHDVEHVSRILKALPTLAKTRHDAQWLPLHSAVLSGSLEIIHLILTQPGVDVSAPDESNADSVDSGMRLTELGKCTLDTEGATPLHYACMMGNMQIVEALVKAGADFAALDSKKRTPIEYFDVRIPANVDAVAAFRRLQEKWNRRKAFYDESMTVDELADMIRNNDLDQFELCLKKAPSLADRFTRYNFTLLHLAVIRQRLAFLPLLLSVAPQTINKTDQRHDVDNYNDSDNSDIEEDSGLALAAFAPPTLPHAHVMNATPLHYACFTSSSEAVRLLMEAGADWEVKDWKGRTPEELIYEDGEEESIKEEFKRLRCVEEEKRTKEKEKEKEDAENVADVLSRDSDGESSSEECDSKDDGVKSKEALRPLEDVLGEKLIGQRGPIRTVANAIRVRNAGWVDPDRPLVLLFLGSSGVGKTELAKQVALYLHGKDGLASDKGASVVNLEQEYAFVRIDMSEYQQAHTVSNLMGSPKGYVGYDDGGFLSECLRKNPRAVVLLDEIEKAHPDVLTVFLQVFDDGRITDSKHGVIYCKDAVFILTSNLASDEIKARAPALRTLVAETEAQGRLEEYLRVVSLFTREVHPVLKRALKRDEFLGRINQMVVFLPLSTEEIGVVVERELRMWKTRAEEKHGIKLSWASEVVKKLGSSYDVNYGARSVANETQRIAVQLIADAHIQGQLMKDRHAYLTTDDLGDIVLKTADFKADAIYRRGCRFVVP